jgi:signal peptidase I
MTNVNKNHNSIEEVGRITKKTVKSIIKLCIFVSLVNLPFITITQLIGIDAFLDSFETPEQYMYLQGDGHSMEPNIADGDYLVLQKSSYPSFSVNEGDIILYFKEDGGTACHRVYSINSIGAVKRYQTVGDNNDFADKPIYENQILGKVVGVIGNNLWNEISIKIWDLSIHNLNINALFTNH